MATYSSDSDNDLTPTSKLLGRQRPIHSVLGGGKVADILLWRDKRSSGAILIAVADTSKHSQRHITRYFIC
ncbi:hypothetical protein KY290_024003 [Solanum tuberosum]|uniref:Uncharacterized protein n=1 Tax=Solanum tuberosum TaxID=4113 RepID=A0ABQ7UQQ3_SOLTU|nr:hypothetical protein KY285_024748 [Solanum tuberosum]KAH0753733.1 hypothetical protein KY290_024003 [Solanum tuberosum]